jgi:starch phosphorylase
LWWSWNRPARELFPAIDLQAWRESDHIGDSIEGDRTNADAEALYRLLEEQIIPLYCRRSNDEIPHQFVGIMKAAIKSVAPRISTRRMVKEYVRRFYLEALGMKHSPPAEMRLS